MADQPKEPDSLKLDLSNIVDGTLEFVSNTSRGIVNTLSNLNFLDKQDDQKTNLGVTMDAPNSARNSFNTLSARTHVKVVLTGDMETKPDRLKYIMTYTDGNIPSKDTLKRQGSLTESFSAQVTIDGKILAASLWTAPDNDSIRQLVYQGADVVVVLYNSTTSGSLEEIEKVWIPELLLRAPSVPWLLASTCMETRDVHLKSSELAEIHGFHKFVKTSDSVDSVKALFEAAFRLVLSEEETAFNPVLVKRHNAIRTLLNDSQTSSTTTSSDDLDTTASKDLAQMRENLRRLESRMRTRSSSSIETNSTRGEITRKFSTFLGI